MKILITKIFDLYNEYKNQKVEQEKLKDRNITPRQTKIQVSINKVIRFCFGA